MAKRTCSVEDCDAVHYGLGYCYFHWARQHRGLEVAGPRLRKPHGTYLATLHENAGYSGDDCLTWPHARSPLGYATTVQYKGEKMAAHRAMCMIAHGPPPFEKAEASHSCGKGHEACINPRHLRWATHADNIRERAIHGTSNRGERCGSAKLTEDDVRAIRLSKENCTVLGKLYQVSSSTVSAIRRRERWKHID